MSGMLIERYEFESPINLEGSWGQRQLADKAKSVMELYFNSDDTGWIEWEVPDLDLFEEIGLTFEIDVAGKRKLVDYDGVMSIPDQALDLLAKHGVDVSEVRDEPEAEEKGSKPNPELLTDVLRYSHMTAEELFKAYMAVVENYGEEEDAERAARYKRGADMIDALGRYLHGERWAGLTDNA